MKKNNVLPLIPAAERWPALYQVARSIQKDVCMRINSINTLNTPSIANDAKDCAYYRQGILEFVISELEKCV